jgi:hypothetical protein
MFGTSKALLAAAAVLLAGAIVPATAAAQEPTTVTGCLSKGESPGTFAIKDAGGKSYWLTSTTVKLDGHVGHKVTITGSPAQLETGAVKDTAAAAAGGQTGMAPDTGMKHHEDMGKDTGQKAAAAPAGGGTLNVTDMKMVSASCS